MYIVYIVYLIISSISRQINNYVPKILLKVDYIHSSNILKVYCDKIMLNEGNFSVSQTKFSLNNKKIYSLTDFITVCL